ncbi:MAG: multicopper oxidase domain-containing protein [Anaerolineales bacterium]|nr:multicopper oxidase domain-containing protein [Anaerolineales bacterium]
MAKITRRNFLKTGLLGLAGAVGVTTFEHLQQKTYAAPNAHEGHDPHMEAHGPAGFIGEVDHERNGFNPTDILTDYDYGTVSTLENGQTLREYDFVALDKNIEVAPGIEFPAWTYNGRIPGPTIRATEGDRIRINFVNASAHPHTIHTHGIHTFEMDGVPNAGPGLIGTGESYTYEFDAEPFGVHLYHCHAFPLARHIAKGLYGAMIIDPKEGWPHADHELLMVMHGYDIDFDDENELYAVNGIPFHYQKHPIPINVGDKVRVFLINILEFDLINSFHLHANFFDYYPTGTSLTPSEYTDTIMQTQAQRGMLEFTYKYPGNFMFHAHNTEFAELGWTGNFNVQAEGAEEGADHE